MKISRKDIENFMKRFLISNNRKQMVYDLKEENYSLYLKILPRIRNYEIVPSVDC